MHLQIDKDFQPMQLPAHRIPIVMQEKLEKELDTLEQQGIIVKVDVSTDWVSCVVVEQKKNRKLRVCLDLRPLNKALKRAHYPMPVVDDLLPCLSGAKVFSVCDLRSGFWHVALDDDSSVLTAFSTPFGRYRWLQLPFGIAPAPEIFRIDLKQHFQVLME